MLRHRAVILLAVILLAGCEGPQAIKPTPSSTAAQPAARLHVLCSTFPIHLFARNVAAGRDNIQLSLLIPAALGCPHDYMLTPQDMRTLASGDVLIINGLGMEQFLQDPIQKAKPHIQIIDSSQGITDLIEMQGHAHEHDKTVVNPHLFASPLQAAKVVKNIAESLAKLDPAGAAVYQTNAAAYAARLKKLAQDFAALAAALPNRKIVTEHAVFDYLARDAGLQIVAVIQESAGQEPSAAEMIELIRTIRRSGAAAVFTEPQYPAKVAATIAREAGVPMAVLDPVANGPAYAPLDYYEKMMADNLKTLTSVLGQGGR